MVTSSTENSSGPDVHPDLAYSVLVFATALLVRLLYLFQSAGNPTFLFPIVDSYAYHNLALAIVGGAATGEALFWQPLFYPCFLAAVYRLAGPSIWTVKIIQAVAGAGACTATYWVGRIAFSRSEGLVAALIMAFYGPLLFFEGELIGEGWAVLWVASLLLLFVVAARSDHPALFVTLGLIGALAVLTRPPLLLFFVVGCAGFTALLHRRTGWAQALVRLGLVVIAFSFLALPVSRLNRAQTGHFGFLPSSGGINLYIGNNPDWERTVVARPGFEWRRIYTLPYRAGAKNTWESSAYFRDRVLGYARSRPDLFLKGLAAKTARFFNSRELPRNLDIYLFRRWSSLLAILTWKVGGFGFPFGVLWPLGAVGLWLARRRLPFPVWAFLVLYPPAIVLYFVSARYRILMIPALVLPAAAALAELGRRIVTRDWKSAAGPLLAAVGLATVSAWPTSFPEERISYEAEMYRALGYQAAQEGRFGEALPLLEKALAVQPDLLNAINDMAHVMMELGRPGDALPYCDRALAQGPNDACFHYNLGIVHLERDDIASAEAALSRAVNLDPDLAFAHFNLGVVLARRGRFEEAAAHFREELRISPHNPDAKRYLAQALEATGRKAIIGDRTWEPQGTGDP